MEGIESTSQSSQAAMQEALVGAPAPAGETGAPVPAPRLNRSSLQDDFPPLPRSR
jgi:hypothetical protein